MPGGDIYQALEKGTHRRAPNGSARTTTRSSASTRSRPIYYYPGWWEGGPDRGRSTSTQGKFEELSADYKAHRSRPPPQAPATDMTGQVRLREPRRRSRSSWRPAPSSARSAPKSWKRASRPPTRSMPSSKPRARPSRPIWDSIKAFRKDHYLWNQVAELELRRVPPGPAAGRRRCKRSRTDG